MKAGNLIKALIIIAILTAAFPLNAQFDLENYFPTDADYLKINVRPENPRPNEKVSISLELYLTDLKKSEISWFLNGELQKKDFGATTFEFLSGKAGEAQKIRVSITTFEGKSISKEITLRPAEVDLVWNANTYTPPFYKGRSLLTGSGGGLTVTAIPNFIGSSGEKVNSKSLTYKWYKDDIFLESLSGYGKDSIKIERSSVPRPFKIKVIAETIDNTISAEETISLDYKTPDIVIYQRHPLYGIMFNKAFTQSEVEDQEITLVAIPFFFSVNNKNSASLEYFWRQNGESLADPSNQSVMIFRKPEDSQPGRTSIQVSAKERSDFRQLADESVEIILND